jgi:hypothetical protein
MAGRIGLALIMIKLVSLEVNSMVAASCHDRLWHSTNRRRERSF